jgi:hypothetical protein
MPLPTHWPAIALALVLGAASFCALGVAVASLICTPNSNQPRQTQRSLLCRPPAGPALQLTAIRASLMSSPSTQEQHGGSGSMTHIDSSDGAAVLVRAADAEVIGFPPQTVRLLADSSATGGLLSTQRVSWPTAPMAPIPTTTRTRPSCFTC